MATSGRHGAVRMTDTGIMTRSAPSRLMRVLIAPFSWRTWAEFWYLLVSVPLAVAGFAFAAATSLPPRLAAVSAPGVRKFGDASRRLARGLLGEDVPAARDAAGWRARGYLLLKLPLTAAGLGAAGICWLSGLFFVLVPLLWTLITAGASSTIPAVTVCRPGGTCTAIPGPNGGSVHVVHQLLVHINGSTVNLAHPLVPVLLGLAREKLAGAAPADLARATQLIDDAQRGAIEAIADLRVLARGIHPPVLDNGLADALATLAARSALPVELITDIPERPSAAIETIAYFSAAELLANAAKHSGARHVTLEAVHVPGLLRIRVSDDGRGGAHPVTRGGLRGLADRVRTVDGRLEISSPAGGPTVVTVELPSRA